MAEGVLFGIAQTLLTNLGSHAVQEIGVAIGVKDELKKLEITLCTIQAVFMDAEEQQLHNHGVRIWLNLIRRACYEADDILDDFATEALRQTLRIQDSSIRKVSLIPFTFQHAALRFAYFIKSFIFGWKLRRRIKEVRRTFDEIATERIKFNFTERVDDVERSQTYSFVIEEEVFGREGEKNEIIELLSIVDGESVVAIIGMGGLGKTTLAQLVYGEERVDTIFELKMWVCIYQEFNVKKITENIIKSATNRECPHLEMDQLQSILREHLKGKRYLLILDDVWNEDSEKWDKMKFMLSVGAKGSKVVVTTRSAKVAAIMGARSYFLKEISEDNCWKLFKERAFSKGESEKQLNLVAIGKEMVKNCRGVPLAAKTLGSLMRFKKEEHEWVSVNNNDVWKLPQGKNDILPALKLSYNHLPFHLKQCFAMLAVYPKGMTYQKNNMLETWIAQGFVHSSDKNKCLEDVGDEYVKELLWRSLFSAPEEDDYGNLTGFKVHDLVYNLAQDVAGTEFSLPEKVEYLQTKEEIRHLNLFNHPPSLVLDVVCTMTNLRSLFFSIEYPPDDIFSNFRCLRDLSLQVVNGSVPSSIGKLKHLRMLLIDSTVIQTIPNSLTKLLNLQTLDLRHCPKLIKLPKNMGRMINLRHVYIAEDAQISCMPPGLRNLASLQTLPMFVAGKGVGCKLNELEELVHLKGQLNIRNLQNVSSARDCAYANLKQKPKLQVLKLMWNDEEGDGDINGKETNVDVLEALQPHSDLRSVEIKGYGGFVFPGWIMEPLFPKLMEISLDKCRKCKYLPPLGQLPSLEILKLVDMDSLRCIDGNGVADRKQGKWFPSLKKLYLERNPNLESWVLGEETSVVLSLACIERLEIKDCLKLKRMPLLPALKKFIADGCSEKLVRSLFITPNSPCASLYEFSITRCDDLESLLGLQGLTRLETLIIKHCPRLVHLPDDGLGCRTSLVNLEIENLPKLASFPQWVPNATKLQTLKILFCVGLIRLPDSFGELKSLRALEIAVCNKLQSLPDGIQQLTALEFLFIHGEGLMSWPTGLENLRSLRAFVFVCSEFLPYYPEQLHQLIWLRELVIGECQTLVALPEFIKDFTSLESLGVVGCDNIQSLPEWLSNITTLRHLEIYECEKLTARCKKETGEDWPKIAQIPQITLNWEIIQCK